MKFPIPEQQMLVAIALLSQQLIPSLADHRFKLPFVWKLFSEGRKWRRSLARIAGEE